MISYSSGASVRTGEGVGAFLVHYFTRLSGSEVFLEKSVALPFAPVRAAWEPLCALGSPEGFHLLELVNCADASVGSCLVRSGP
jgi:hypothetical protein